MKWRKTNFPSLKKSDCGYSIIKTGVNVVKYKALAPEKGRNYQRELIGIFYNESEAQEACETHETDDL